jgi:asparagine synthase (glutamine-hydrolysing)
VSGFAGLVAFDGSTPDPRDAAHMADALVHRGSDEVGAFSEGPAAFVHRTGRLRPDAPSARAVSADLVVLFDGWIDPSRTEGSDADRFLAAWRDRGLDALDGIDGEFAAAVWDRRTHTLALVRDRLGTRPTYWCLRDGRLAFASELAALVRAPGVPRTFEAAHLAEYLSFQVVHAPRTLVRDVWQVEPACVLVADGGTPRTHRYWAPRYAPVGATGPPDAEVVRRLQDAVADAVRRRIPPTVETGLFLSGGLGSAAIAAAARDQHVRLPGFTVALADETFPEAPVAGRVARLLGLAHREVVVGSAELAATFDDTVRTLGHPIGHPAAVLQLALARAAGASVRAVLSGDGSDELFGGRMLDTVGRSLEVARLVARLPPFARRRVSDLASLWPPARRATTPIETWALDLGLGGARLFTRQERARLLRDPDLVRPDVRRETLAPFYAGLDTDPINTTLHGWLRSNVVEGALPRAERTAAAAGLDVRFPLLDRRVVEAAAALPGRYKRRGGGLHTRWLLRSVLSGVLPTALVDRPKRGLPAPLGSWLAGPGRLFLEDRVARLRADPHGLFRAEGVEVLHRDVTRSNAAGSRLWTLFVLDSWLSQLRSQG